MAALTRPGLQTGAVPPPSFASAASNFSTADFPGGDDGPVSHASSSNVVGLPFAVSKAAVACLQWHFITATISFA